MKDRSLLHLIILGLLGGLYRTRGSSLCNILSDTLKKTNMAALLTSEVGATFALLNLRS